MIDWRNPVNRKRIEPTMIDSSQPKAQAQHGFTTVNRLIREVRNSREIWHARRDSNPQPSDP
jgi:hypothetical protein